VTNARFAAQTTRSSRAEIPPASPEREASVCGSAAALPLAEPLTEAKV